MDDTDDGGRPWTLYAKIAAAFAVALALLVPLPTVMQDPETDHGAIAFWALLIGAFALYGGWDAYKRAQLVRDTPTSTVRSLAVGAAEVKGTAHPVGEPLVSPLTHQEACMYELRVQEHHPDDDGSDWETVLRLSDQVPFHVDDGTGRVRVEPEEATLTIEVEERVEVDEGDPPPDALGEWATTRGMVDEADAPDPGGVREWLGTLVDRVTAGKAEAHLVRASGHDRRYRERVLAAGESAYVFGGARRREGAGFAENERNLVLRTHEGTGRFLVSDKSESELLDEHLVTAGVVLALALLLLSYGLVAGLYGLGLV